MNKQIMIIALVCAQLAVPSMIIAEQENILKKGEAVVFKTAPVDPYDIFRGRYVALRFDEDSVEVRDDKLFREGQDVYLVYENDNQGYAKIVEARPYKPMHQRFIKSKCSYVSDNTLHYNLPFDRYYMNEDKAYRAEQIYRENARDEDLNGYIVVRVLNGKALIEAFYVDDKLIESYFL